MTGPGRPSERGRGAIALLVFSVAAVAIAWPGKETILAGTEPCGTVPLAMAWSLGVSFDRFAHGLVGYWDAPIFHPVPGAFAMSEPMPLVALLAWPLSWLGVSLPVVHTLAVWTHLVLDAWFARRLALRLGTGALVASTCGLVVETLPFVHQELGVLTLVAVWPALWALERLLAFARAPTAPRGAWLGVSVAAAYLCSAQMGVMLALALVPAALASWRRDLRLADVARGVLVAVGVLVVLVGPVAWTQHRILDPMGFQRSVQSVAHGSMHLRDLWHAPFRGPIDLPIFPVAKTPGARAFVPGVLELLLAGIGAVVGLRRPAGRRRVVTLLVFAAAAVVLALGTHAAVGPVSIHDGLARILPGYARIRSPFRAVAFAQLAIVLLAALGLRHVFGVLRARHVRRAGAWVGLVALAWALEELPPRSRVAAWPRPDAAWIAWLKARPDADAPVAHVPFAHGSDACAFEGTARAMVSALQHGHPLANGYSSYFPPRQERLSRWADALPDDVAVRALRGAGLRYLVVEGNDALAHVSDETLAQAGLARAFVDPQTGVVVLAIER